MEWRVLGEFYAGGSYTWNNFGKNLGILVLLLLTQRSNATMNIDVSSLVAAGVIHRGGRL